MNIPNLKGIINFFKLTGTIVFLLLFFQQKSTANHVLGGNVTYTCLGNNQYEFTLDIYIDCFGATEPPLVENLFFFPECSFPFSAIVDQVSLTEISNLCESEIDNSSCNGGFVPGTWLVSYSAIITLANPCTYEVVWSAGDWNYFVNIDNAGFPNAYFQTTVDNTLADCAESVEIASLGVPYYCIGQAVNYDIEVDNPENFTLNYSLTNVLTDGGVSAIYEAGYTGSSPIPGITINANTGVISFTAPNQFGTYAVGVLIEMYDGLGNLVGTLLESMCFVIRPCLVAPTQFTLPQIQSIDQDGQLESPTEASVCLGGSMCIEVEASNANIFRAITLSSDVESIFPGATFTQTGTNPVTGLLCLTAQESYPPSAVVSITATDDECNSPDTDVIQLTINILSSLATSSTNETICFGSDVQLNVSGDADYTWNVISGEPIDVPDNFSCADCGNPVVSPSVTTVYEVIGNSADASCNQSDTIEVVVLLANMSAVVTNESCLQNDGAINLTVPVGSGNYSYAWSGPNGYSAISQDISGLDGGNYSVVVSDLSVPGCQSIVNSVVGSTPAPTGSITNVNTTICEGECVDIVFDLSGTGPYDLTLAGAPNQVNVPDGHALQVCPLQTTTYTLLSVTDNNNPSCTVNINDQVTVTVLPEAVASFLPPNPICTGGNTNLVLDIDQLGSFNVSYTDGVTTFNLIGVSDGHTINVNPTATTTYTVTSISRVGNPSCPQALNNSVQLVVYALPQATLVGGTSICLGAQATLTFDLSGTGPFDVTWNNGVNSFTANNVNDNATVQVSPGSTTTYCISSVVDSNNPSCTQAVNSCVDITVLSLPTATLSQDVAICQGDDADIIFSLNGQQAPYDVSYTVNGSPATLNNIGNGYVLNVSPGTTSQYCVVNITDSGTPACSSQVNDCVNVTVQPLPTANISGSTSVCPGDCVDIALDLVGVAPFTVSWEIEDLETNTITPQAALVGINDGYLLNVCPANTSIIRITGVSDSFNPVCTNTAVTEFEIEVDELSTASLQQDVSICEGSSGEIGIVFSNPTAGPWEISMSDNLGNTYNLPAITPADLNQGVYYYTITPQGPLTLEITAFTDGSLPCTAFSGEVFVLIEPVPFATIAQDAVLCPGSTVGLTVGLPSGGPFDVVYNDGVNDFTLAGISDGFVFDVEPLANTTYTLVSVTELDGALNCTSSVIDESATISVVDAPLPSAIDTLCDDTGENFQVVFELNGGDPLTYSVTAIGAGQGSLSAAPPYVYTSAVIPSGSTVSFEIEDGNPCTPYILEMDVIECPVLTDAGTMDNSLIEVCNGEAAIAVWNNDGFLDGNDELMYVLHDSPGASLGLVYEIDCNDAGFNDGDTPLDFGNGIGEIAFGVTYYISAVAGNDDGTNDCVNLNHPDISVAPGTPVVFYQTPSAFISGGGVICEGETAQLQVDFTGIGPWDFEVALAGVGQGVISTNTNPFVFEVENPGVYTLVSFQNAICSGLYNGQANLLVNPLPTATILSGGEICEGDDFNLEIALTGTAPWEIQLAYDDGNTELTELLNAVASPFFHPVAEEGLYFIVQVIDGNNCNNQVEGTSVELLVNGLPEAVMLNNDVETCDNEGIDLSFELIGEAPWLIEYSINGIIQDAVEIAQSPFTLFTDIPGTYVLESVSDGNNCFGSVTGSFEYTSTPSPVANAGPDLQVCSGIDVLIGTPALPGLVYSWVDPQDNLNTINQAQAVFTAINNGVNSVAYTVTLTVSDGLCSDTSSVSINVLNSPPANAGPDIQTCLNEPVQLNASGGVACVWEANPALDDPSVCNPTANPLVNTEFVVEVEGANGCFKSDTVLVEVGDPIVLQALAYSTEVCFNTCDGIIDLQAQGGFGNYSFEWTFPDGTTAFGSEINDLCSGDYLVTVTDINGCSSSDAFFIAELPEYDFQQVSATAAVCFGESNGIIEVVSSEAISFAIDNGPALAPNIPDGYLFAGLGEGTYTISAVNDIGCVATDQIQIDEYSQINLFPSFDEQQACFQEEITFSAFANGGGGIFTYFWIDENNALLGNGTTLELIMEAPTVITVYAEDQNGCLSDEYEMEVFFGPPITADIFPDPDAVTSICEGDQITISANLGGGLGFIAPQWVSLSSGQIISNQSSFTISPDEDDFYVLTAVDGCSQPLVDTVQVVVMETPAVEIGFDVISGCAPLQVQLVNLTNELLVDQCLWDFGDGNVLAACIDTISYLYVNPGTYTVSLTVTSSQGCISSSDMQADIVVHAYPLADFTWEPNPPSNLENIVQIVNQSTGASNYLWDFGNLGQSGLPNPLVELPAVDYGVFPACLTAISPYGCIDTICREIVLEGEFLLWVPNAFTPDGDGRNEVFQPIVAGANPNEYSFRIFDRWGQLVFETTKLDEPWSGNFSGGSYYVQNDVYVWQIICEELISGNRREFTGHVTIIR